MTIDNKTTGGSKGRNASSSYNNSQMKRNLMDANEVEQLDKSKCIIMTQGNYPILANKYKIETHKLYKELGDVNEDNKNNYEFKSIEKEIKKARLIEEPVLNIEDMVAIDEDKAAKELLDELANELSNELDGLDIHDDNEMDSEFLDIINN